MQYSAEFIILAPPFDSNFQITWQKITSWENWILTIKPRWLPFILDSPTSAPRGQRLLLQPVQKTGTNPRVPILLILDILCADQQVQFVQSRTGVGSCTWRQGQEW